MSKMSKKNLRLQKNFMKLSGNNYKILAILKKNFENQVSRIYKNFN